MSLLCFMLRATQLALVALGILVQALAATSYFLIRLLLFTALALMYVIFWFLSSAVSVLVLAAINTVWYGVIFSNSELTYLLFNHNPKYYEVITETGMWVEDVPQFIIQLTYSLYMHDVYGYSLTTVQILSFVFTFWRFMFTVSYKFMIRNQRARAPASQFAFEFVDAASSVASVV